MKRIIFLSSLILTTLQLQAQTWNLKMCRETALKNNAAMAAADYKVQQAGETERQYYTNYLPNFKLVGGALYNSTKKSYTFNPADYPAIQMLGQEFPTLAAGITPIDLTLKTGLSYAAGVMLEQPLYMGGKITAAHTMSQLGQEVATQQKRLSAQEVLVKTDEAYVLAIKAGELYKVAKQYHEMLAELLRVVENSKRQGMAAQNDVLRVQVKLNESELQMRKAENAIRLAKMNLCHAIGIDLKTDIQLENEYPTYTDQTVAEGVSNRPEYLMLRKQVEVAAQQVKLSRSEFMPNVGLMLGYSYANAFKLDNNRLLNNFSASALLTVSVPLFHFGEGTHKIKAAKAQKAVAEMEQREKAEMMELELAQAQNNLDEAKLEVAVAQRSLSQADENLRVTNNQYKNGMSTLTEVLEAQTLWQQAYESHVEAKFQEYLMHSKYLKAVGLLQ